MAHLFQDGGEEYRKGGVCYVGEEEDGRCRPRDGVAEHGTGISAEASEEARGRRFLAGTDAICFPKHVVVGRKQTIFSDLLLPSCQIGGTLWRVWDDPPCYRGNDHRGEALEKE